MTRACSDERRRAPAFALDAVRLFAHSMPRSFPRSAARICSRARQGACSYAFRRACLCGRRRGLRQHSTARACACASRPTDACALDGVRHFQRSMARACSCAWRRTLVVTFVGARLSRRSIAAACSNARWRVCACGRRRACSCGSAARASSRARRRAFVLALNGWAEGPWPSWSVVAPRAALATSLSWRRSWRAPRRGFARRVGSLFLRPSAFRRRAGARFSRRAPAFARAARSPCRLPGVGARRRRGSFRRAVGEGEARRRQAISSAR